MNPKVIGLAVAVCVLMLFGATSAQAALEFYVSITGAVQGPFKGEVIQKGFEGKIAGLSFDYSVVSPRDLATGQATGRRVHKPIRIMKVWGAASTQLFSAITRNETLTTVVIDFVAPNPITGVVVLDHTIKLTNAFVTSIAHNSETPAPGASATAAAAAAPATETVEFVFQQIELIDHKSKSGAMDNSSAP